MKRAAITGALALCGMFFLGGCAGNGGVDRSGSEKDPSAFADVAVQVKNLKGDFVRKGNFVSVKSISQVTPGSDRDEVIKLLGHPLSQSGDKWWFYNINLPLQGMDDYLVCQYRVTFDGRETVAATTWRRPQCQARYNELLTPPQTAVQQQEITLSGEALFSYDSVQLTPSGEQELDKAAKVLLRDDVNLVAMKIIGHTDRIGTETYNRQLSLQRAEAVGAYFRSKGVPAHLIVTEGRGSSEPLVFCEGNRVTQALKNCLQPNRRVQIAIDAVRQVRQQTNDAASR